MKLSIALIFTAFFILGCEENKSSSDKIERIYDVEKKSHDSQVTKTFSNLEDEESIIASINSYRELVENEIDDPFEITSSELREKTKQKWEKIHFYAQQGEVIRIKSYPYEEISERTEEFYIKDNQLVLAVIEDQGLGKRGKELSNIDKMYYFYNDSVIKEIGSEKESDFTIKNSDGEELFSEVKEYLKIYSDKIQKSAK